MPPPATSTERQKLLIQQEIARLQGQIASNTKNPHPSSYHPYRGSNTRGGYRGSGRGGRGRGRGRGGGSGGGSYSLDMRSGSSAAPSSAPSTSRPAATEKEDGELDSPPPEPAAAKPTSGDGWVKKTSRGGNMSLMTVEKRKQLASQPPPPRRPKVPSQVQVLQSTGGSSETTDPKRVVIDGVIFEFQQGGEKLVRVGELPGQSGPSKGTPTRQSLKYGGESYRRTKRGNLMSRSTLDAKRAEQAKKPCRYYTKTGRCARALTCPYQHNPEHRSICPSFLRGSCTLGDSCPLSHTPSAHNTPSCKRFQATASCYLGDACPYPHVGVSPDAPVCEDFAREGWCDREAGTCPKLHVWECPEWHAKGTCSRQPKCGLNHFVRGEQLKTKEDKQQPKAPDAAKGGFDEQSDFIGFPGEVFSDSESEEDNGDEANEDEDGSESGASASEPGKTSEDMDTDDDDEAQVLGEV